MKSLAFALVLFVATAAGAWDKSDISYSTLQIEHTQALLAADDATADAAWGELLPAAEACLDDGDPDINSILTPDYSHDDYTAQCASCTRAGEDCCQLDMGSNGPCDTAANGGECDDDVDRTCNETTGSPMCDMMDASGTVRNTIHDAAQCAHYTALVWRINHELGAAYSNPERSEFFTRAHDIIIDHYQMTSIEIQADEHFGAPSNESALNALTRMSGTWVAGSLIWDGMSGAQQTAFLDWIPVIYLAVIERRHSGEYSNHGAGALHGCLFYAGMKADLAAVNVCINGGVAWSAGGTIDWNDWPAMSGEDFDGTLDFNPDEITGLLTYLDDGICPSDDDGGDTPAGECDLNMTVSGLSVHGYAGEIFDDADRETDTSGSKPDQQSGEGSKGLFYSQKALKSIYMALQATLHMTHLDLFHYSDVSDHATDPSKRSSFYEASRFMYEGSQSWVDHASHPWCVNNESSGVGNGTCDTGGAVAYCSKSATCAAAAPGAKTDCGFWGGQDWDGDADDYCKSHTDTNGDIYDTGHCNRSGLKTCGYPGQEAYGAGRIFFEQTWKDFATLPTEALSGETFDVGYTHPELIPPTLGLDTRACFSACCYGGPSGAAGDGFTPCHEEMN